MPPTPRGNAVKTASDDGSLDAAQAPRSTEARAARTSGGDDSRSDGYDVSSREGDVRGTSLLRKDPQRVSTVTSFQPTRSSIAPST
jgi:hypothetical protein